MRKNSLFAAPIACLLALALVLSLCPAAFAEGAAPTSIFVATDRHDSEGEGNNLVAVLSQVAADPDAVQPTVTVLGGDSAGMGPDSKPEGHPPYSVSEPDEEIFSVLGTDVDTYYTFGSHDTGCTDGYDAYLSGPVALDGCYLYGISYAQMLYATDEQTAAAEYSYLDIDDANGTCAATAAANFLAWVDSLEDSLPIIVMSHVPMHVNRNDNLGASTWVEALNEAAKTHDIIALFGHNHSQENNGNFVDRPYYLVPAGASMPVQGPDKEGDYAEPVTIDFTYMNAGYLIMNYGSLLTFNDVDADGDYDEVKVQRYSTTGKDDAFGDTGIACPYTITLTK